MRKIKILATGLTKAEIAAAIKLAIEGGCAPKEIEVVDEDVLDYFKSEGDGYQRRINAVLRSYMQQKAKPKKRA